MAEDVGELVVRIEAKLDNLQKGLNKAGSLLDNVSTKATKTGGIISNALSFAGGLGIVKGVEKLVEGLSAGVKMGVEFDSTMQQNKIAFEAMLGSAEKADDLLGKLSKMAAETPFEFPELTTAAKKMLAFGFAAEKIPDMMKNIGDAAAGLGLGAEGVSRISVALGQMQAKQKIQAGEVLQLTEAGIPALDILAKHFGKTTAEISVMQEKGLLPVQESIDALITGMGDRFPNMMAKQSKSFAGLMSTLKDNVQMTFGKVLQPAFEYATNTLLPAIIDKTSAFTAGLEKGGIIGGIKALFPPDAEGAINNITSTIGGFVSGALSQLQQAFEYFTTTIIPAYIENFLKIANIVIPKVSEVLTNLYNVVMPPLKRIFEVFINDVLPKLSEAYMSFVENVAPIIIDVFNYIVTNVLPPVIKIFEFLATKIVPMLAAKFQEWIPKIAAIVQGLWDVIKPIIDAIVGAFEFAWPYIEKLVSNAIDTISDYITGFLDIVQGLTDFIKGVFTGDWELAWTGIKEIFIGIWDLITSYFGGKLENIKIITENAWNAIKSKTEEIWNGITNFFTVTVVEKFNQLVTFFSELPNKIGVFLIDLFTVKIPYYIGYGLGFMVKILSENIPKVIQFFKDLPGNIAVGLVETLTKLKTWSLDMVAKAKETGQNVVNGVVDFVKNLPSNIATWFTDTINKIKEFATGANSAGGDIGKGIVDGVIDFVKTLPGKVFGFFDNIISGIGSFVSDIGNKLTNAANAVSSGFESGSNSISGARALGGSVSKNSAYLVGEKGAEIFTPSTNGTIIPANETSSILNGSTNYAGMVTGNTFYVRSDSDIKAIAREFYNLTTNKGRALGVR
jgi:tape measure domain-containing protein